MTTGPEQQTGPAQAQQLARAPGAAAGITGHEEAAAPPLAKARPYITRPGAGRADTAMGQAGERTQGARSVGCTCQAAPGVPCGPSGDHLARYLRAEQSGAITRQALKDVIADLDVIAPQVIIQPRQPRGERATHIAGAEVADPVAWAQLDAG